MTFFEIPPHHHGFGGLRQVGRAVDQEAGDQSFHFSSVEGLRRLWESCHFCSSSRLCYVILDKLLNHPLSRFPHLLNEEAVCRLAKIQGAKAWGVLG